MEGIIRICARCREAKECPFGKHYCRECQNLFCREYKAKNREKIAEYNKKYKAEHKEDISKYNHNYNKENREAIKERQKVQHKERRQNDYNFKRSGRLRTYVNSFIKNKTNRSNILNCTKDLFFKWLQFNFKEDMNFENYGDIWCIDHVLPCSLFDFENDDDEERCFHWSNLRPLYKLDNNKRVDKVTEEEILYHDKLIKNFIEKNKEDTIHLIHYDKLKYLKK